MECGRDMNAAMSRMVRYRRRVKYSGRGRAGAMARERRLRRWDEMSVVDKRRSNINVYVRNGMRNGDARRPSPSFVDIIIMEIVSNDPFMLYI